MARTPGTPNAFINGKSRNTRIDHFCTGVDSKSKSNKGGMIMFDLMPWRKQGEKEVVDLRRNFDDLVSRFWNRNFMASGGLFGEEGWFPSVDVSEGKKEITVRAEIPGMEAKDIDISLNGKWLTIKGEKKQEKEEKDKNYHRVEHAYGCFHRTVELPVEVDAEKVDATYKKGVLKIELKKTRESASKRIEIKSGN
jgi:HSP20 family protein